MYGRNSYHIFIAYFGFGDLSFLFEAERFSSNILNLFGRGARVNTMPPGEAGFGVGMRCVDMERVCSKGSSHEVSSKTRAEVSSQQTSSIFHSPK